MPSAEASLFSILTDGSPNAVADLVASRVYPDVLPQNVVYPAIRYVRISTARSQFRVLNRAGGKATRQQPRFQIDCFATTRSGVNALAVAVRETLDGFAGIAAGLKLDQVWIEEEGAELETEVGEAASFVYRTRMDFFLSHAE